MSIKKIAVVGTGTDVGKTVLSLMIMKHLFRTSQVPMYVKPFQTGCPDKTSPETDAAFICRHVPQLMGEDPSQFVINCHQTPKAPYFSARDMGQTINPDATLAAIGKNEQAVLNGRPISHLIIEAAGGLLVPITETDTVASFIAQTKARPVIAAHAGLGTINHTLLTLECLDKHGIEPAGVVFMETGPDPTPVDLVAENMEAIASFSGVLVAGVIPFITDFAKLDSEIDRVIELVIRSI